MLEKKVVTSSSIALVKQSIEIEQYEEAENQLKVGKMNQKELNYEKSFFRNLKLRLSDRLCRRKEESNPSLKNSLFLSITVTQFYQKNKLVSSC